MTYKFIQDLKAEITGQLPNNTTGLITPAILRGLLQDMTDSLYSRVASLIADHTLAAVPVALTAVPTNFPALYTANFPGDVLMQQVNQIAGTIAILKTGVQVDVSMALTIDGPVNTDVRMTLFRNGVASQRAIVAGQTAGAGERFTMSGYFPTAFWTAGDVMDVRLSTPGGPAAMNVSQITLTAIIQPTFAPL